MALSINKIYDYYSRLNFNSDGSLSSPFKAQEVTGFSDAVKAHENEPEVYAEAETQIDIGETSVIASENGRKDYFFTNYNDVIAQNFGLIFDVKV
jgi:hypothetical protein